MLWLPDDLDLPEPAVLAPRGKPPDVLAQILQRPAASPATEQSGGGEAASKSHTGSAMLLDLIEEVEREEEEQQLQFRGLEEESAAANLTEPGGGVSANGPCRTPTPSPEADEGDVDALVALVRREVRAAVDREFSALLFRSDKPFSLLSLRHRQGDNDALEDLNGRALEQAAVDSVASTSCGKDASFSGSPPAATPAMPSEDASGSIVRDPASSSAVCGASTAHCIDELEAQIAEHRQALASLRETFVWQMEHWDQTWKLEAELRAEGDQEVENRLKSSLESKLDATESQLAQVSASVGSLARLQVELGSEAKIRQEADGRLQAFLRDFRAHVVNEVEEMWRRQGQLSTGFEGLRNLMGQVVELVELRTGTSTASLEGALASARVAGPDELEATSRAARGSVPHFGDCTPSSAATSGGNSVSADLFGFGDFRSDVATAAAVDDREIVSFRADDSALPFVNVCQDRGADDSMLPIVNVGQHKMASAVPVSPHESP